MHLEAIEKPFFEEKVEGSSPGSNLASVSILLARDPIVLMELHECAQGMSCDSVKADREEIPQRTGSFEELTDALVDWES